MTERQLGALFTGAGLVGLTASTALTYDKLQLLQNPAFHPSCNINPVISCGSVMHTAQATMFGLPNSVYGLAAFTALTTFGLMVLGGAKPGKRVWLGAQGMAILGVTFVAYLIFQSLVRIGALCPWCFMVWVVTVPVFWYTTLYNLDNGNLPVLGARRTIAMVQRRHGVILGGFYVALVALILVRFWYYWRTLL